MNKFYEIIGNKKNWVIFFLFFWIFGISYQARVDLEEKDKEIETLRDNLRLTESNLSIKDSTNKQLFKKLNIIGEEILTEDQECAYKKLYPNYHIDDDTRRSIVIEFTETNITNENAKNIVNKYLNNKTETSDIYSTETIFYFDPSSIDDDEFAEDYKRKQKLGKIRGLMASTCLPDDLALDAKERCDLYGLRTNKEEYPDENVESFIKSHDTEVIAKAPGNLLVNIDFDEVISFQKLCDLESKKEILYANYYTKQN